MEAHLSEALREGVLGCHFGRENVYLIQRAGECLNTRRRREGFGALEIELSSIVLLF